MTNTLLLKEKINASGFKLGFIAQYLGISRYALALKINNKREFKASEIDALCKLLNINVKERMRIFFAQLVDLKSTAERKPE